MNADKTKHFFRTPTAVAYIGSTLACMSADFYGNLLPEGTALKAEIIQMMKALDGAQLEGMQQLAYVDVLRLFTKNTSQQLAEIPEIRKRLPAEGDLVDQGLLALLVCVETLAR